MAINGARLSAAEIEKRHAAVSAARARPAVPVVPSREVAMAITEAEPVDTWVCDAAGLRRWKPFIERVDVTPLPNGERILRIGGVAVRLNEEASLHIAGLLGPKLRA